LPFALCLYPCFDMEVCDLKSVYDVLFERGFIEQVTDEESIREGRLKMA